MDLQKAAGEILHDAVASGLEHGIQCAVWRDGRKMADVCAGVRVPDGKPVTEDTLFPVFSAGKGVTATVIHLLAEQGKCGYQMPYSELWPAFGYGARRLVTLEYVLSHRSGMHNMPQVYTPGEIADWDGMCEKIASMQPEFEPGSRVKYQPVTFSWLAGEFAARAGEKLFRDLACESVLCPLGMEGGFYFGVDSEADSRVTLAVPGREMPRFSMTEDTPCYVPVERIYTYPEIRKCCLPGAGALATANALALHYQGILDGFLSGKTLDLATKPSVPAGSLPKPDPVAQAVFGLGYGLFGPENDPGQIFGFNGYGGSTGIADRKTRTAFALVKTDLHLGDDPTRRKLCDLLGMDYMPWARK